jgi:hypothetical protein
VITTLLVAGLTPCLCSQEESPDLNELLMLLGVQRQEKPEGKALASAAIVTMPGFVDVEGCATKTKGGVQYAMSAFPALGSTWPNIGSPREDHTSRWTEYLSTSQVSWDNTVASPEGVLRLYSAPGAQLAHGEVSIIVREGAQEDGPIELDLLGGCALMPISPLPAVVSSGQFDLTVAWDRASPLTGAGLSLLISPSRGNLLPIPIDWDLPKLLPFTIEPRKLALRLGERGTILVTGRGPVTVSARSRSLGIAVQRVENLGNIALVHLSASGPQDYKFIELMVTVDGIEFARRIPTEMPLPLRRTDGRAIVVCEVVPGEETLVLRSLSDRRLTWAYPRVFAGIEELLLEEYEPVYRWTCPEESPEIHRAEDDEWVAWFVPAQRRAEVIMRWSNTWR